MSIITEIKTIKIDHECKTNPVYLFWQGTNSGPNYWLFHKVQTEVEEIEDVGEFFPYVDDLETALGNAETIGKNSQPELVIGAYVDVEDLSQGVMPNTFPGLKGLLRSPNVLMLTNLDTWEEEGPKWMRVRVAPGTFKILDTDQAKARIELTLLLPTINIQQQ